ncbi:MAG: hypothetical protein ACP5E4_01775 [Candidatus Aenigmatarchaeota archaeon]
MASWIWVIGSILFGMIILYAGYSLMGRQVGVSSDSFLMAEISGLEAALERVCVSEGVGARDIRDISLPENVRAVYISNSAQKPPPDSVSSMISGKDTAVGNYLCFQLTDYDENIPKYCWELSCRVNLTYIGTPTLKKTLASRLSELMGGKRIYRYRITLTKTGEETVRAAAEPVLKD